MKTYHAPRLTEYGGIAAVTAVSGGPFTGDVSYDVNGNVDQTGTQSINNCPIGYTCSEDGTVTKNP